MPARSLARLHARDLCVGLQRADKPALADVPKGADEAAGYFLPSARLRFSVESAHPNGRQEQ